jgi:hypothetical protein
VSALARDDRMTAGVGLARGTVAARTVAEALVAAALIAAARPGPVAASAAAAVECFLEPADYRRLNR